MNSKFENARNRPDTQEQGQQGQKHALLEMVNELDGNYFAVE